MEDITITAIKADIGSIGGHLRPSKRLLDEAKGLLSQRREGIHSAGKKIILSDFYVGSTGDDICLLLIHRLGEGNSEIHQLAWNTFFRLADIAKEQGLYGAGQDLLADSFSGNIKGLGPGIAEMQIQERENEAFLLFTADKTEPGAFNLPLYLSFADPMYNSGLMLSPKMTRGFTFLIQDVSSTEKDKTIALRSPSELYDIACLLRDNEKFVIKHILSGQGETAVASSTDRLHNIAGRYVGKDDPVALVRVQGEFPATGEILAPYSIGHYVAGFMRGSHIGPLMPVKAGTGVSYFDGPPIVSGLAFSLHNGKLTEPVDVFDHPFWDHIRTKVSQKAIDMREQGFSGPAMLGYNELEYTGITERMEKLERRFQFE